MWFPVAKNYHFIYKYQCQFENIDSLQTVFGKNTATEINASK